MGRTDPLGCGSHGPPWFHGLRIVFSLGRIEPIGDIEPARLREDVNRSVDVRVARLRFEVAHFVIGRVLDKSVQRRNVGVGRRVAVERASKHGGGYRCRMSSGS